MSAGVLIGRLGRGYNVEWGCMVPIELEESQLVAVSIPVCNSWGF